MKLIRKTLMRLFVAGVILGVPRVALASPDGDPVAGSLNAVIDNLSEEALGNFVGLLYLSGCFGDE